MNRLILLLAIVLAAVGQPAASQTCSAVPAGAAALGYTVQMFAVVPTIAMVSTTDTNSTSALYPGEIFASVATNLQELQVFNDGKWGIHVELYGSGSHHLGFLRNPSSYARNDTPLTRLQWVLYRGRHSSVE